MKKALMVSLFILLAVIMASSLIFVGCSSPAPAPTPAPTSKASASTSAAPAPTSAAPAPTTAAPAPTTTAPPPAAGTITIKFGYDTPPTTNLGVPADFFAKTVNEQTQGRVKVQNYPAGTLVPMGTALQALRTGVADMYVLSYGSNISSFPIHAFTSLPGLSFYPDSIKDMKAEVDTMRAIDNKYKSASDELQGIRLMWSDTYSTAVLMGKKQIHVPAELVGVKTGVDGMRQETTLQIGGVPVFTIPPQMYQQLQTGVVDSVEVAWGAALDWQLQEQTKNVLDFSFGGSQMPVFMSTATWNKLSPQDQKILTDVAAQAEQVNREEVARVIPQARAKWAAAGVKIYQPTADEKKLWMDKYQGVWDKYISGNKAAAPDIQSIFNDWKTAATTPRN